MYLNLHCDNVRQECTYYESHLSSECVLSGSVNVPNALTCPLMGKVTREMMRNCPECWGRQSPECNETNIQEF